MKKTVIVVAVIIIIAVVGFLFFRTDNLPKPIKIDTTDQPTLGKANAPVHIVAFEDLKCVNCMRFSTQLFPKIKQKYIKTGIAKFTLINVAFIEGSMPAANAARCVYKQNSHWFFPYIEQLYANQPPESENWATVPYLLNIASKVPGINKDKLAKCILASPYSHFMQLNLRQGMRIMRGTVMTPTLYINGRIVEPLTMQRISKLINAGKNDQTHATQP